MKERKILILTNRVPFPLNDGGNLATHVMIEGYRASGWQVYLLAMNTSKHALSDSVLNKLYVDLYKFEWVNINNDIKSVKIIRNYLFSKEPEHVERFYNKSFEQKIADVLYEFKPDVVQVESVYLTTYLPVITHNSHAVKVLRLHNIEYHIWHGLAMKSRNKIKRRYLHNLTRRLKEFERASWKKYDLLLPITEKDAFHVTRLEKISDLLVAPFSMKMDAIPRRSYNEKWVGYHLGAMDWIPNREGIKWFLHEAWPKIHNAIPKFEFYFAGRNMPEEFKHMKIEGVHCEGEVENAADFIEDKKILIVPVATAGGIRVKIMEAMAAGKIVITTPEGIKGLEARAGEHYLLARKPEDFVKAIKWCVMNNAGAEEMADKARELVTTRYDYRTVIKTIIDELEGLLKLKGEL